MKHEAEGDLNTELHCYNTLRALCTHSTKSNTLAHITPSLCQLILLYQHHYWCLTWP